MDISDVDLSIASLLENDVLIGIVGGSLLMSLLYVCRTIPDRLFSLFKRHFTTNITITNDSPIFKWVQHWIAKTNYTNKTLRMRLVYTPYDAPDDDRDNVHVQPAENSNIKNKLQKSPDRWSIVPAFGDHYFFHEGRLYLFNHELNENATKGKDLNETIKISTFGRNRKPLEKIILESYKLATSVKDDRLEFYIWTDYWKGIDGKEYRHIDSIIMDNDEKNNLMHDLKWFLVNKAWYKQRSIPYKRGYLFSGPPGTGKTSLIMAMASGYKMPLYILNLSTIANDVDLFDAFTSVPPDGIIVLEDIDAINKNRAKEKEEEDDKKKEDGISLSGLLNVLDGLTTPDGRIVIMTTNYPERIDAAIKRPGRIDKHIELKSLTESGIMEMYKRFYNSDIEGPFPEFTGAELQQLFIENTNAEDAKTAIRNK